MTAIEKQEISLKFGKTICKFINKHCIGMSYHDLVIIVLENARAIVQMCVRYNVDGCRKNAKKASKVTYDIFREYGSMTDEQREQHFSLKDDTDEQPQNEEDEPCK